MHGIRLACALLCVAALGSVGVAGQGKRATTPEAARALKNPVAADTASINAGTGLYAKYCRACHGQTGLGDGPGAAALKDAKPSNLADGKWEHGSTDGEIFINIKEGIPPKFAMNGFGGRLQDTQIWNIVNYIKTLSKGAK